MNVFASLGLSVFFPLILAASPGFDQKAADIVEKMIEAQGGREVLNGIRDATLVGSVEWEKMTGRVTIYRKEPNRFRQDLEIMKMIKTDAFDGETAWSIEAEKTSAVTGRAAEEYRSEALGYAAFLNPEKHGVAYELKGQKKVEGRDYFILEQTIPGGTPLTHFVDAGTYLVSRIESPGFTDRDGVQRKSVTLMSDYKKVDGVMLAHTLISGTEGWETVKFIITKVTFNAGLEDSLFKMAK